LCSTTCTRPAFSAGIILLELGRNRDANWQDYLDELAAKGMSREPADR
jgi:DUF971 family protein